MTKLQTISDGYVRLNQQLHEAPRGFGGDGDKRVGDALPLLYKHEIETILDYGAGQGKFKQAIDDLDLGVEVVNYDPAVADYCVKPIGQFDLVACTDVLEHVEPEFLANVLDEIWDYSLNYCYLLICCVPANKVLPDGRNAHLIQETPEWWMEQIVTDKHPWKIIQESHVPDKKQPGVTKKLQLLMEKAS